MMTSPDASDIPDPRASANLLLIEVGNSHVALAAAERDRLSQPIRIERDALDAAADGRADRLGDRIHAAWANMPAGQRRAAVMASVVPEVGARIRQSMEQREGEQVLVIGEGLPAPISTRLKDRAAIGVDRLCAAAAAYDEIQAACVVAGFGTATTIDCVDEEGVFLGGAILPGLRTQARSLREHTAKLPEVDVRAPTHVFGVDTADAIVNGIVHGAAGALREIVERYATHLGRWPRLVLTGGYAPLMRETCDFVDAVVPDLVLRGMRLSYREFFVTRE